LSVPIGSPALPTTLAATSWLVADLDSGDVLGACGAHRFRAPASVQKLLLMATVLPKLDPDDKIIIVPEDRQIHWNSSLVGGRGLVVGGTYRVEDVYLGLLLNSGNEAAQALARLAGGSRGVAGGLEEMNAEAHRLGAWDTHAVTPSGLDGPGQVTSVYDLALIFRACFEYEQFRRYIGTRTARMPAQPPSDPYGYEIQNDNRLLLEYPGAFGGKTGLETYAGHTFVGAAERNGRRLVVAVLGVVRDGARPLRAWQHSASLLDWGFSLKRGASVGRLVAPGDAEKLMAPPPSPTPEVIGTAEAVVALPSQSQPSMMLVMVGAGAVAFGAAWVLAVRLYRRRRTVSTYVHAGTPGTAEPAADQTADRTSPAEFSTATPLPADPLPADPPPATPPLMGQPPP
jgi:D-alanyl-D-alanine carboxypeptidase (penicillin-binding protein 5/6)